MCFVIVCLGICICYIANAYGGISNLKTLTRISTTMNALRRSYGLLAATSRSAISFSPLSPVNYGIAQVKQLNNTAYHPGLSILVQRNYGNGHAAPLSKEHFDKLVKNEKVVVFMKGVPDEPRCGFSNAVVQILRMHGVTKYDSHNVLEDEGIRQGIKEYTNWPTIPQVFINGEFVGGCDILIEMHKNGELVEQLSKVGIKSALLDKDEAKGGDNNK